MSKKQSVDPVFWSGKRVLVTGHTGFKGSWLTLWLARMGAQVTGYALPAPTAPSLFELAQVERKMAASIIGDVNDLRGLKAAMDQANPEIVIHMAAQPLVRASYADPVGTMQTNIMGTVHLLEAARTCHAVRAIVNVTTDKCYENREWHWGYRENEPLGGYDPYSSSKACSELVTAAYRSSFFEARRVRVATARAGNVIGGGDWALDRLVPDIIRSMINKEPIVLRSPDAVRPWQHVLEPLSGYLLLAQLLYGEQGDSYSEAWNFGPQDSDAKPVEWIVQEMLKRWTEEHPGYKVVLDATKHEAGLLKLDISKAAARLGWSPKWTLQEALAATIDWVTGYRNGADIDDLCWSQIEDYMHKL